MKFGRAIRAARLGFHALPGLGLCRIADSNPPWEVTVIPFEGKAGVQYVPFISWWEGDTALIERTIRRWITAVHKPVTIWLNDDGDRVEPKRTEARNGQIPAANETGRDAIQAGHARRTASDGQARIGP